MFHQIPAPIRARMAYLEEVDARDRTDGTPKLQRLRQIPAETGKFLALLAASAPPGELIEIGASGGYSTLWLSLACRERGARLTTFEILPEKIHLAGETYKLAGVEPLVHLVHADARDHLPRYNDVAFCFLDAEKDLYQPCYDAVVPKLVTGGFFVADNAISHAAELASFLNCAYSDERVDALVAPIGKGVLVCRKA
jgi:caffeoyl-CoA O-methyltransferase